MKKLLFFAILTISIKAFSQEVSPSPSQENVSVDKIIYDKADTNPVYPGGIDAFRKNFYQTFDSGNINGKGKINAEALFVIDQNGYITEIKVNGENKSMNKEMTRAIKAMSKTKWKPAKLGGIAVKYRFRLPIATNL
ncbi:energy transducer TonB [Chryseobacterium turcicum]|uniref:Energy transducer TonB n=1 Tax=Chryseobacterium turcicum TaxID=2898076 RepID=A0A9Q3V0A7_9FLAO|nr:energy transducer TonB [Chryseobacterium turcicum]MCD1115403.1 energy transducer TonB [Chryseobacterium turcicum]